MNTEDRELRLRHLDALQNIVGRLSQNSFTIRGWSVTLASVILAFASTQRGPKSSLVILALVPAWIFWGLDAYYLRQERLFRSLHVAVAHDLADLAADANVEPFDMRIDRFQHQVPPWRKILLVPHVVAIPAALTVITAAVALYEVISN